MPGKAVPGKIFDGRVYYRVDSVGTFRKRDRADDQATRIRRSGYFARIAQEQGAFVIYACTKYGRPIPAVWKKIDRQKVKWR